jgi:hypothetical protein
MLCFNSQELANKGPHRHVVTNHLVVNISVLCDFADKLCAYLVALAGLSSLPPMHDITLPNSWLAPLSANLAGLSSKKFSMQTVFMFATTMAELLQHLSVAASIYFSLD